VLKIKIINNNLTLLTYYDIILVCIMYHEMFGYSQYRA